MPKPVTVTFLGGLGEVGRNSTAIEYDGRILVIDFGLMFPDETMPGVDVILPDDRYLLEQRDAVEALIITHGHEDHVGGVPYFLREFEVPLYGSALTMGIAESKVDEAGLSNRTTINVVADGEVRRIGPFEVEFLPITHSVPQSMCVVVHSPQGVIVHTGDFKLDFTPVDDRLTDLGRIGQLASTEGIRLLMADSTNADSPGFSDSETTVGETLRRLFPELRGRRIITSCFASHLHRVQQIVDVAIDEGRTVFPLGRSMVNNIRIARDLGVLDLPEKHLRPIEEVDDHDPATVCVLCTGSQGEQFAALSLMAKGEHRDITVGDNDTVIMSSHPIPGNEHPVFVVMNALVRRGAEIIHSGQDHVHTTGHAKRDELRILHSIAKPEHFCPVEGEYRMLRRHLDLAVDLGLPRERAFLAVDGNQIVLSDGGVELQEGVPHQYHYLHGNGENLDPSVLAERLSLADGGVVMAVVTVDLDRQAIVAGPTVLSRGWATDAELDDLLPELERELGGQVERALRDSSADAEEVERVIRRVTGRFVSDRTRRRPPIVALVQTVG